jgi:hypothetical protein
VLLLLQDFTVTPDAEGTASDTLPLAPDSTIDTELPLVAPDDAGAPFAPNAPPHIPAVPQRPTHPLTPPVRPSEPRTPSPDVKDEPSTPHPIFELRSPTPAPRSPVTHTHTPEPSPSPEASPAPAPVPRRSGCSNKGCAPGPNVWNATDRLRGIAHTVPVQTYAEGSRR